MSNSDESVMHLPYSGGTMTELGDLLAYEQPTKYLVSSTGYSNAFDTPVLTAGQTFILGYTDETDGIYSASSEAPVIIFDDFTTAFQWVDFPFKAKSSAMKMLRVRPGVAADLKFVYYAMRSIRFTPTEHARYWISAYSKIRIPFPPLSVQREIVRRLNTFTELEGELEGELEARRQQYQHYRDSLLAFPEQSVKQANKQAVRWMTLGEVGTLARGRRFTNEDFVPSGIGCIHYGEVYTHYGLSATNTKSFVRPELAATLRMARKGDLVIAGTGENVEEVCKAVAWLGEDEVAVHDDCYIFRHSLDPNYVAHFFRSGQFHRQKVRYAAGAKMIRVSGENLERIRIPVPPLAEQRRIAAILDRFDALVNDLSSGLPAELNARRQQYEYYRDRLLTFREAA